jgi:lipopolysaccharide/colanic/teichoic acid biosynthesis glycosyltransferase
MKNIFDLFTSTFTLIILSPILLIITLLVFFIDGSPVLFKQLRPGFKNKPFFLYKFRTMGNILDSSNNLLEDANRITNLGNFLRKTSLDELPSFWNVLKCDMSLVGPRPLLMEYLPLYSEEQMRRQEVKPGITGWAQINGRNSISWEEKFNLDVWYVNNRSLWLDMKIILLTIFKVLRQGGISQRDHATMEKFRGNN